MNVKLYVEGGGDSEEVQARCREAFRKLLEKAGFKGRMPRIVACGGRNATFDDFRTAHSDPKKRYFPILLVDSEGTVSSQPWEHLTQRDGWTRPDGASEEQAQLMVACMETWILADRETVRKLFKKDLRENSLLPVGDLERRGKDAVQQSLEDGTRGCPRDRQYLKGKRSFQVVAELDPAVLERELPHFKRLLETLRAAL